MQVTPPKASADQIRPLHNTLFIIISSFHSSLFLAYPIIEHRFRQTGSLSHPRHRSESTTLRASVAV